MLVIECFLSSMYVPKYFHVIHICKYFCLRFKERQKLGSFLMIDPWKKRKKKRNFLVPVILKIEICLFLFNVIWSSFFSYKQNNFPYVLFRKSALLAIAVLRQFLFWKWTNIHLLKGRGIGRRWTRRVSLIIIIIIIMLGSLLEEEYL